MSAQRTRKQLARLGNIAGLAVLGLLAAVLLYQVFNYLQQGAQQDRLGEQIARFRSIAASGALERIEKVKEEYQKVQEAIPSSKFDQLNVFEMIKSIAEEKGIKVTWTSGFKEGVEKVQGVDYRLLTFSLTATGSDEEVWGFVRELDKGQTVLRTLVMKEVRLRNQSGDQRLH